MPASNAVSNNRIAFLRPTLVRLLHPKPILGKSLLIPSISVLHLTSPLDPRYWKSSFVENSIDLATPSKFLSLSATLIQSASVVNVGYAEPLLGNTELLPMYKFCIPCTWQLESTTPSLSLSCIRVVPMWWLLSVANFTHAFSSSRTA